MRCASRGIQNNISLFFQSTFRFLELRLLTLRLYEGQQGGREGRMGLAEPAVVERERGRYLKKDTSTAAEHLWDDKLRSLSLRDHRLRENLALDLHTCSSATREI